jgi:hypothetical protein
VLSASSFSRMSSIGGRDVFSILLAPCLLSIGLLIGVCIKAIAIEQYDYLQTTVKCLRLLDCGVSGNEERCIDDPLEGKRGCSAKGN